MSRVPSLVALAALATLAAPGSSVAAKSATPTDRFLHPRFAEFQVRSIAVLPVAVLHPADGARETVGRQLERSLAPLGYRWVSPSALRSSLGASGSSAEIDKLVEQLRRTGSLDTTAVRPLGQAGVADAILATLVTTWERETIEFNMTGQSMTQVGLQAFLYSTRTGELLWSRRFQVRGEGPYNNPGDGSGVVGVTSTGLQTAAPRTSTSLDPPTYEEIAAKLGAQVAAVLPPPPRAADAAR